MSLRITHDCINCGACEIECPQLAVFPKKKVRKNNEQLYLVDLFGNDEFVSSVHFYIDPLKCNNCEGSYPAPRCIEVCPVPCCLTDSNFDESEIRCIKQTQILTAEISLN